MHHAPIRVGCVSYLNTLPLIEGLGKLEGVHLHLTAPAKLVDLLVDRDVDLALVSIIDYQTARDPLAMVPVGMIGCDGPTMTVRLFSRIPPERITTIHADADSHTSVTLAQVLISELSGRVPEIVPFDADPPHAAAAADTDDLASTPAPDDAATTPGDEREWPEALLLIGDKVVRRSPPAVFYPHQMDLGDQWKRQTGLPFMYATWMCREDRADDPAIAAAAALLDRQRRHNATRLDWIVNQRAAQRGWPIDAARHYLRTLLKYDVTPAHERAAEHFFDCAHELRLLDDRRQAVWLRP